MATNRRRANGRYVKLDVSAVNGSGASDKVLSGDPVAKGQITGVAISDEDADGNTIVDRRGVYDLAVKGVNDVPTNTAIAQGDKLYWDNTLGEIDVGANGVFFGWALDPVTSGATTTIKVLLAGGSHA